MAVQAADARIRMAALRGLAAHVDDQTLTMLVAVVRNSEETDKVRAEAARLLGRTGEGALAALVGFLRSNLSVAIRTGVLRGLAELGSPTAVESVLEVAQGEASHLRPAAIRALAEVRSPEATPLLTKVAGDASCRPETRVAVCRALAEAKDLDAVVPLKELLADREAHADVRAAAVEALGRIGGGEALSEVVRACGDPVPAVALEARIARSRIEHVSPR